jgi:hypothetical protein
MLSGVSVAGDQPQPLSWQIRFSFGHSDPFVRVFYHTWERYRYAPAVAEVFVAEATLVPDGVSVSSDISAVAVSAQHATAPPFLH